MRSSLRKADDCSPAGQRPRRPAAVHDCSNRTIFAGGFNLKAHEAGWFGAGSYGSEFETIPFEAFPTLPEDENLRFLKEKPLPEGYRIDDIIF